MKTINPLRRTEFLSAYVRNRERAAREMPDQYEARGAAASMTTEELCAKMTDGLFTGRANKDSHAIKWTCKELRIRHTYKAIQNFLAGGYEYN